MKNDKILIGILNLEDKCMSKEKSLTNHHLGIALASLIENFEKSQKQTVQEQK